MPPTLPISSAGRCDTTQAVTETGDPEVETSAADRVIVFPDATVAIAITLLACSEPGSPTPLRPDEDSVKSVQNEAMADVRDMYLAHSLFRREFAQLPDLILSIADGDIAGAEIAGSHVAMLCLLLHLHHEGEDLLVWPRLAARGGAEADAIVPVMETQHHTIEVALARVDELLPGWRSSGRGGDDIANTFQQLLPALIEHMALEEREILPLAEKYITSSEWKELVAHAMGAFPKKSLPLVFGLMMEQGDPAVIKDILKDAPLPVRLLMPVIGPPIATAHNKRLRRAGQHAAR